MMVNLVCSESTATWSIAVDANPLNGYDLNEPVEDLLVIGDKKRFRSKSDANPSRFRRKANPAPPCLFRLRST